MPFFHFESFVWLCPYLAPKKILGISRVNLAKQIQKQLLWKFDYSELGEGVLYIKKKKGHLVVYSHLYNKCYITTTIVVIHIVVIYKYSLPHFMNCLNGFILIFCYIMMSMYTLKYMLHRGHTWIIKKENNTTNVCVGIKSCLAL